MSYRLVTMAPFARQKSPDSATGAKAVPINQIISYVCKSAGHKAKSFGSKELGINYTRLNNPAHDLFERRVTAIKGGSGALAVASGQSDITFALLNITRQGDNVTANKRYGGIYALVHYTFLRLSRTVNLCIRRIWMGEVGAAWSPINSWLCLQGLETLQ